MNQMFNRYKSPVDDLSRLNRSQSNTVELNMSLNVNKDIGNRDAELDPIEVSLYGAANAVNYGHRTNGPSLNNRLTHGVDHMFTANSQYSSPSLPSHSASIENLTKKEDIFTRLKYDMGDVSSQRNQKERDLKSMIDVFCSMKRQFVTKSDAASIVSKRIKLFNDDDFMPPFDSMMSLRSSRLQRDRFFEEVAVGDVFCSSVLSVTDSGLDMVLLCYACNRNREIDQLKIMAQCSSRDIPELLYGGSKEVSDVFSMKDKVAGVVIGLSAHSDKLQISLLQRDLPNRIQSKLELGLIRSEDLPPSYKTMCMSNDLTYSQILKSNSMFPSLGVTKRLCHQLDIQDDIKDSSILDCVVSESINPEEKASALRKQQSKIHALHSVIQGVKLYKEGKQMEALVMYNKALDIDPDNEEALVARGAMYANNESYQLALEDFKYALKVNTNHQNAKSYLVQTLQAYARDLEDGDEIDSAIKYYKEILMYDPFNNSAKESLTSLCGAKTFTVEQAPAVISTRAENSTSLSPSRGASLNRADRRSKDSMTSRRSQNRNLSSGSRNSSLERRRKSVMSDNYRPSQRNSSSGRFYNEERGDSRFKRSASQQSSSSSSSSSSDADAHPKKPPPESKKKLRRSSSSSSSSSVQSIKQPKSELNLRSPSMNSRGSARRSSNLEKSGSHDKRDISQKRKDRFKTGSVSKSRSRSRSRNQSRGHSRNRSRGHSRSRSRGRSRSRSRSRSKSGSKVKYHSHSTRSQSVETKAAKVLGAPEVRDRYGLVQRGTKHLDIFGNLDEEPAKSPKKPVSNTSFLPYCLSTDPAAIKKSLVKPFAVKVKKPGEGESKTLSSFMIKAQHGKRKAVIDLTSTEKKLDPTNDSLPPGSPSKQLAKLEPTPSRESLQSSSRSRSRSKSTYSSRSRSRSHSRSRSRSKSKSRSHHRHRRRHRSRKHDSSRDHKSRRHGRRRRHSRESHRRHRTGRRRSKRSRSRDRKQRYRSRSASKNSDGGRLVCRSVLKQDLTPAKGKPINVQPQTAQPAQANLLGRQPIPATVTESGPAKIAQASLKSLVNQAQMANQNLGQQKNQLQPTKKFVIGKKVKGKKLGAKTGNKLLANQIKQGQGKTEKDQVNKAKVEKIAQEKKLQQMEHFLKSLKEKKGGKQ